MKDIRKEINIVMIVFLLINILPITVFAETKHVTDCIENQADCEEVDQSGVEDEKVVLKDDGQSVSLVWNIIKMILALAFIFILIYALLWFLKKKNKLLQTGLVENIGGISVGQNKSVQIIQIASKMYLVGVGDNVELIKELTEEEMQDIMSKKPQNSEDPIPFIGRLFPSNKDNNTIDNRTTSDFNTSLGVELKKIKEQRHHLVDEFEEKDGGHV